MEYGQDHGYVGQMAPPEVGVVEDVEVPLGHLLAEVVTHGGPRHRQRTGVHRDPLPLGDELAVGVQNGRGEIPAGVQDLGHGGAQHHLHHLQGYGLQSVPQDRHGYGVGPPGLALGKGFGGRCLQANRNLRSAVPVHGGPVSRLHQHGGEVRLDDGGTRHLRAGGEAVHGVYWDLPPLPEKDPAMALQRPIRIGAGLPFGQTDPRQMPQHRDPQDHQPDLLIGLAIGVELLVPSVEGRGPLLQDGMVRMGEVRNRNGDLVDLVQIPHVRRDPDFHVPAGNALIPQPVSSLVLQLSHNGPDGVQVDAFQAGQVRPGEVVLKIGGEHSVGRHHGGHRRTYTLRIWSWRATLLAWSPEAPPKATKANRLGSIPRFTDAKRMPSATLVTTSR